MFKKTYELIIYHLRGGVEFARFKGVIVGSNCRIYIKDWGTEPHTIDIGNNVTIAGGVKLLTHDGSYCLLKNKDGNRLYKYGAISIGDNVFIGANSILLPGVKIGSNVIIGAGSIVTKSLEPGFIYAGNPARKIKTLAEFTKKANLMIDENEISS